MTPATVDDGIRRRHDERGSATRPTGLACDLAAQQTYARQNLLWPALRRRIAAATPWGSRASPLLSVSDAATITPHTGGTNLCRVGAVIRPILGAGPNTIGVTPGRVPILQGLDGGVDKKGE